VAEGLAEFEDHGFRVHPAVEHGYLRVHSDVRAIFVVILNREMQVLFHF
jgi:hypothetical protein